MKHKINNYINCCEKYNQFQQQAFVKEFALLSQELSVPMKSKLLSLNECFDENGLLSNKSRLGFSEFSHLTLNIPCYYLHIML